MKLQAPDFKSNTMGNQKTRQNERINQPSMSIVKIYQGKRLKVECRK
jgi:hypothetical protein